MGGGVTRKTPPAQTSAVMSALLITLVIARCWAYWIDVDAVEKQTPNVQFGPSQPQQY